MHTISNETIIKIADHGLVHELSFAGLLDYHDGDSVWGLTVAFRALQLAACLFSEDDTWDRKDLFVVSSHPGPGVRDAIEYVTDCVRSNQYTVTEEIKHEKTCNSSMKFEWKIIYGIHTTVISLRDNFVPVEFYELLDQLNTGQERSEDKKHLEDIKSLLIDKLWRDPIISSFLINHNEVKGERINLEHITMN